MHYDKTYSSRLREINDEKALLDVIDWLGEDVAEKVAREIATSTDSRQQLHVAFAFAGIQGYPVDAFIRAFRPDLLPLDPPRDEEK